MTSPHLRVGSVSLGSARKAARAAKAAHTQTSEHKSSAMFLERYLGHFGASSHRSPAAKAGSRAVAAKRGAKKASAKKIARFRARKSATKSASRSKKR